MATTMISQRQLLARKVKSVIGVAVGGTLAFGGIGLWTGNEKFYRQFVSPFLARMDPETGHRAAVLVAKYHLIRDRSKKEFEGLETKVGSLKLPNPIGIAAGFDKSAECMSGLVRMGFGWVEIGSVTPLPQEGNPKPRVFRLPEDNAVINRYGFNNDGHEEVHSRVVQFKGEYPEFVVGVNLGANKNSPDRVEDYCKGIRVFSDTADYFVINISSPNTPNLRELQQGENLSELLKRVLEVRNLQNRKVPVFIKVAPDLNDSDIQNISALVVRQDTKVDGLIVSNTTVSRPSSLATQSPSKMETGGLSGQPLENMSTELVGKFYKELKGQIPIIGVGGVHDGHSAYQKIRFGASAVQIYTALAFAGPGLVDRVKVELKDLLSENGFQSISDAVGSAHNQNVGKKRRTVRI